MGESGLNFKIYGLVSFEHWIYLFLINASLFIIESFVISKENDNINKATMSFQLI